MQVTEEMVERAQRSYYQSAKITVRNKMTVSRIHLLAALESVAANFEQQAANDNVRRLREEHRCPVCGAEEND